MIQQVNRASVQLTAYKQIYSKAPSIETTFKLSTEEAYQYCMARRHFVLVTPYTPESEFLVERTFTDSDISWSLIGGSLRSDRNEDFIEAANRMVHHSLDSADLADIEPIAFLCNRFQFEEREWSHEGVAFAARLRGEDTRNAIQRALRSRSQLIPPTTPRTSIALVHNARVFDAACTYLEAKDDLNAPFHEHEIAENLKYRARYKVHDLVFKPLLRFASSHTSFPFTIADLNDRIHQLIYEANPASFIDVACGENELCGKLAQQGEIDLVVGNDVSWSQIELMQSRDRLDGPRNGALLFTNHDATRLPFDDNTFSVSICKNVLHHMPDRSSVQSLIAEASRVAERCILIEVMDPMVESVWGKVRHQYYLKFLHDAAVEFYKSSDFDEVTRLDSRIDRFDMKTIRGVYQFAVFQS